MKKRGFFNRSTAVKLRSGPATWFSSLFGKGEVAKEIKCATGFQQEIIPRMTKREIKALTKTILREAGGRH